MSTKRAAPGSQGRTRASTASTAVESTRPRTSKGSESLSPIEEKVVRMRRGIAAPDDLELGQVGQSHAKTRALLLEIEARAFERSGRLDELRREAGLEPQATDGATKDKIIANLTAKAPRAAKSSLPAKATKSAKSSLPAKATKSTKSSLPAKATVTASASAAKAKSKR
ncbi:hypothetical protein L6R52_16745 [Myxococcota bacterium]|nr:hypothetical protein [Myxococcota bacterium]